MNKIELKLIEDFCSPVLSARFFTKRSKNLAGKFMVRREVSGFSLVFRPAGARSKEVLVAYRPTQSKIFTLKTVIHSTDNPIRNALEAIKGVSNDSPVIVLTECNATLLNGILTEHDRQQLRLRNEETRQAVSCS